MQLVLNQNKLLTPSKDKINDIYAKFKIAWSPLNESDEDSSQHINEMYEKMMRSNDGHSHASSVTSSLNGTRAADFNSRDFNEKPVDDIFQNHKTISVRTLKDVQK